MAGFDGNGNYVRPYNWTNDAANALPIDATKFDTDGTTVKAAFELCLTRDNQGKPTTALSWAQTLTLQPASGVALTVNGVAQAAYGPSLSIAAPNTAGQSNGLLIKAGTTVADAPLIVTNAANTFNYFGILGDASWSMNRAAGAATLVMNATGNLTLNAPSSGATASFTVNTLTGGGQTGQKIDVGATGTGSQALLFASSGGTAAFAFGLDATNAYVATGSTTPTLGNKPGASTSMATWLRVNINGATGWIPVFAN